MSFYVNPYGGASFGNPAAFNSAFPGVKMQPGGAQKKLNTFRAQVGVKPRVLETVDTKGQPVQGPGSLASFQAAMKNITPGMLQSPSGTAAKTATKAVAKAGKKSGPVKAAVARKLGVATAAAAPPPPDPLDTLRTEYGKYFSDMYGGLEGALGANAEQFKTRTQEIADRLKAQYGDAANVAAGANQATQSDLEAYAQRMGLQQATQGETSQNWVAQNERLKALNAAAQANSLGTNDIVRSNYYDFLVDRAASAKGSEAVSQAGLLDLVSQAKAQRLLMQQQAAAAAAARARSSRSRKSGGGGGSSGSLGTQSASTKLTSANDANNQWMIDHPDWAAADLANIPTAKSYLDANVYNKPGTSYANLNPRVNSASAAPVLSPNALQQAIAYALQTGGFGGPKASSTVTVTGKKTKLP